MNGTGGWFVAALFAVGGTLFADDAAKPAASAAQAATTQTAASPVIAVGDAAPAFKSLDDKGQPWDSAEHLKTDEDMTHYLEACLEEGDPALIAHALGVIAKARGMTMESMPLPELDQLWDEAKRRERVG